MHTIELNLQSFSENTHDGILVHHEDRFVYANRSIEEMLGYAPGELLNATFAGIIAADQCAQADYLNGDNGKPHNGQHEIMLRRKDGNGCPAELTATTGNWHGKPATIFIVHDISGCKRNEAALRDIESRFHQLTGNIREVFFVRDLDNSRIIYASPAYEEIWKRPLSDLYDNLYDFVEAIHPDDRRRILDSLKQRSGIEQSLATYQYRILWPDGEIRWIRSRIFPITDEAGHAYCVAGIAEDITAEKIAEDKLRLSEMQLRQIIDLVPHAIFVKDRDGRFLLVNKAKADLHGTTVEELTGALQGDIHLRKDQVARMQADDRSVLDMNLPKLIPEEGYVDAAGRRHILQTIKIPFTTSQGGPTAVLGVATDITERKRAEDALQLSEERLSRSLLYANIGNWDWNIQTGSLYWSERVAPLFGYEPGAMETSYEVFLAAIHPDDRQRVEDAVSICVETGEDYDIEHRVLWPDGTVHWLHEAGGVVYDDRGQAVQMLGIVRDITKRKLAEQALMYSEEKYRAVMENASDAILLETMAGWIIDANRQAEEFLGYSRDELLQMHGTAIHPKEDHPVLSKAFRDLMSTGNSLYEHLVLRKNGSVVNAEVAVTTIAYQGEKMVMAIFRDTTARKLAEEERLMQAKAHRETLVREVHHRIKNNLQGVMGLLRQHATRHPDLGVPLKSAIGQVNSIALVHGLYGQGSRENIILCEMISAICHAACGLTGRMVEPNVTIDVENPVRIATDEAVPLALILNELIFNAIKHHAESSQPVRVFLRYEAGTAGISIVNPDASLPPGFDFLTGQGLGTGLNLVKSLLPNGGCQLRIADEAVGVIAELQLEPPVILPP